MLKKENYKRLKAEGCEKYFNQIIKGKYKSATTTKMNNLVADVYEDEIGPLRNRNWTCGRCVYNMYEPVAKLYNEYYERWVKPHLLDSKCPE